MPEQVARLVESGLEFNDARHLFARFGRLDQGADKGRVITNPIDGHFDRDGLRVGSGRPYEVFHSISRKAETLIRHVIACKSY